jgi:general secretion pathway protein N
MIRDPVMVRLGWSLALVVGAALAWLALAAGLGRAWPAPADGLEPPAALPALPESRDASDLREAAREALASRPAFSRDRTPAPYLMAPVVVAGGGSSSARLTGTVITPAVRMATIDVGQPPSLRLRQGGEAINGWRLLEVTATTATVEGPGGTRLLTLESAPAAAAPGSGERKPTGKVEAADEPASAARSYPLQGVAGRGLPVGSAPVALAEQELATRQRTQNERRRLRELRQSPGNEP